MCEVIQNENKLKLYNNKANLKTQLSLVHEHEYYIMHKCFIMRVKLEIKTKYYTCSSLVKSE